MAAIVKTAHVENWQARLDARVAAVISNRSDAKGLDFARSEGIATAVLDHRAYPNREAFDEALAQCIGQFDNPNQPTLVLLAGFMRILTPRFVQCFSGRLLNIHPSLLPAFPGLDTHQRAINAGCKLAGATVHLVTQELDHGPILAQAAVPILASDTVDTLAARVLTQEHLIYPRTTAQWLMSQRQSPICFPMV